MKVKRQMKTVEITNKLKCGCVDSIVPCHLCPNITVSISFKNKSVHTVNFWIQEPFKPTLFENDPHSAGKFIETIMRFAKKELQRKTK